MGVKCMQQPTPVSCSSCNSNGHVECKWCAGTGFFIIGDNMLCEIPSRNTTCVICAGEVTSVSINSQNLTWYFSFWWGKEIGSMLWSIDLSHPRGWKRTSHDTAPSQLLLRIIMCCTSNPLNSTCFSARGRLDAQIVKGQVFVQSG